MKAPKFKINNAQRLKAKDLGVTIDYSNRKGKKISVFRKGKKVADVGALGYWDFESYVDAERKGLVPMGTAQMRRRNYWKRHAKELKPGTPGYYALKILW